MSSPSVTCSCGVKVRLPADGGSRNFRCPKCKAPLSAAQGSIRVSTPTHSGASGVVCPICQSGIAESEPCVKCPECHQVHHQECWKEIGGCASYGCAQAPAIDKSQQSVQAPLSAWGDTKKCPACGETIKSIALRCRYCQTEFDSVDPLSVADLRHQAVTSTLKDTFQKIVVGAFVASLIGCLAPFCLIFGLVYLLPRRQQLAKSGPVFVIMGWTSIVLSGFYCLLMMVFFLANL